jgi:hypothetical protein
MTPDGTITTENISNLEKSKVELVAKTLPKTKSQDFLKIETFKPPNTEDRTLWNKSGNGLLFDMKVRIPKVVKKSQPVKFKPKRSLDISGGSADEKLRVKTAMRIKMQNFVKNSKFLSKGDSQAKAYRVLNHTSESTERQPAIDGQSAGGSLDGQKIR